MTGKSPRSLLRAIEKHPENQAEHLKVLRAIVAQRLDETDSARETGTLARAILDIEAALRHLNAADAPADPVDDIAARRAARGAR